MNSNRFVQEGQLLILLSQTAAAGGNVVCLASISARKLAQFECSHVVFDLRATVRPSPGQHAADIGV